MCHYHYHYAPPPRMALLALVDEVGHSFVGVLLHCIEPCSHLFNPLRTIALASWFICATDATHGDIFFPGSAACGRLSECHCCSQLNFPQRQPVGLAGCTCWSFEHEYPSPLIEGALTTPPPTSQDHMTRIMLSHTINLQTNQQVRCIKSLEAFLAASNRHRAPGLGDHSIHHPQTAWWASTKPAGLGAPKLV